MTALREAGDSLEVDRPARRVAAADVSGNALREIEKGHSPFCESRQVRKKVSVPFSPPQDRRSPRQPAVQYSSTTRRSCMAKKDPRIDAYIAKSAPISPSRS